MSKKRPLLESKRLLAGVVFVDAILLLVFCVAFDSGKPTWSAIFLVHLTILSVVTVLAFGLDKGLAAASRRRISEANLLWLSALGGAIGGVLGIFLFHHKNRHRHFRILVPLAVCLQLALFAYLVLKGI